VDEESGAGAAGWVDRGVGDRDADQVDEGEAQADGDGGEAFGGALVCAAEDDQQEEAGEDDFDEKAGEHGVAAGGVVAEAVCSESTEDEVWPAAGDDVEDSGGNDGSCYLGDDVGAKFRGGEALADDETDGDCGVEVAAGDVANGEGHSENCEPEGEGNADEGNTEMGGSWYGRPWGLKGGGKNGASATTEDKPEGPEEFS